MANALYDKGREFCLEGAIAWLTANIKVTSIDETDDVPVLTTDDFLAAPHTDNEVTFRLLTDPVEQVSMRARQAGEGWGVDTVMSCTK